MNWQEIVRARLEIRIALNLISHSTFVFISSFHFNWIFVFFLRFHGFSSVNLSLFKRQIIKPERVPIYWISSFKLLARSTERIIFVMERLPHTLVLLTRTNIKWKIHMKISRKIPPEMKAQKIFNRFRSDENKQFRANFSPFHRRQLALFSFLDTFKKRKQLRKNSGT